MQDPRACINNLKIYKDSGCAGAFTWAPSQYEDRFLTLQTFKVAGICCSPDSTLGVFEMDDFILTDAPNPIFTVVAKDEGHAAAGAWLLSQQPAVRKP